MVRCAIISAVGVVALALGAAAAAEPVSDAFTYQGRLESSGSPAQGLHDLRFTLYDAPTGGASVGPTLSFNVLIQNGLFTLPLNFGPDAFDGERRFLEIEARATNPLDPNPFETLTPRQEVSPAPHAGFSIATRGISVDSAGNVGVGVDTPLENLHVGGSAPALLIAPGTGAEVSMIATDFRADATMTNEDGATTVFLGSSGSGSAGFLQVEDNSSAIKVKLDAEVGGINAGVGQLFNSAGTETIRLEAEEAAGNGAAIKLKNFAGQTTIELDAGLGSSGDGRIITQELQITGGSDLSEQFDISSDAGAPRPGMVVSIDAANAGRLTVSSSAHDKRVAGVISGAGDVKPGMLMGQRGTKADGEHPVALTGRVYVWCDADAAPIEPGDLLTTSTTPGHAMKVLDHRRAMGAIIGKAMTPLESGRGLVLVLVSLQ